VLQKATMKLHKETLLHGKWYGDACGAAYAFELIGERWSALILREMMFGPRRFTDLRAGLPSISAKVLTERLEGLEQSGLLLRRQLPPPAATQVYELTPLGRTADDVLLALCRWALAAPGWDRSLPTSNAAMMMSMRALFDAEAAAGPSLEGAICIGGDCFGCKVQGKRLSIKRREPESPDFTIESSSTGPLRRLIYGKTPPEELAAMGLSIAGDRKALQSFVDLFHLPVN
jgi:DNA-binding HxlR family transcriptional regulator